MLGAVQEATFAEVRVSLPGDTTGATMIDAALQVRHERTAEVFTVTSPDVMAQSFRITS